MHGQKFGTTRGGPQVDVFHHIPLGNWFAAFSFVGLHATVSLLGSEFLAMVLYIIIFRLLRLILGGLTSEFLSNTDKCMP